MRSLTGLCAFTAMSACAISAATTSADNDASGTIFEEPVRLKADGEFINTDIGHAAPYLYDIDDDGDRDLLVGQFGEGKLRIYHNIGSNESPKYDAVKWFKADHEYGTVPTG